MSLPEATSAYLLALAWRSIHAGVGTATAGEPDLAGCPSEALEHRATFVTLTAPDGALRGCRGMLEPLRPLAADVWHNAWASAFDDRRFAPVTSDELEGLRVGISVLGPLERLGVTSEEELRRVLVPHRDGVALTWRNRRATLLPQVWEMLPDPREFLAHLKIKAGLPPDFWARDIEIRRYEVEKLAASGDA
jgi:hypothetical protein